MARLCGKAILAFILGLFILISPMLSIASTTDAPTGIAYHGRIIKPDGTPLESASVDFYLEIVGPANKCILYKEKVNVNMTGSSGVFSLILGTGTRLDGGVHSFNDIFMNNSKTFNVATCYGGGTSYTSAAGDERTLKVSFDDGSGAGVVALTNELKIRAVPYAVNSEKLAGLSKTDFIQVNTNTTQTKADDFFSTYDSTMQGKLRDLVSGTPDTGAISMPTGTTAQRPATAVAGMIRYNTSLSQTEVYDGSSWNAITGGGGGSYLPLAGGTMTGAVDMGNQNFTNVGFITMGPSKTLHLSNNASDPAGLVAADAGKIWYNSTTKEFKYWDGAKAVSMVSKAGGDTITASGSAVKPLVLKGAASQSANLFEVDDSTSTAVATISATGAVSASTDLATKSYVDTANTTQDTTIAGKVAKAGDTMTGNLVMSGQKQVRYGDTGSNYVAIQAPTTVGTSYTLTLPSSVTAGGYLMTDASGNLSWSTPGGGGEANTASNQGSAGVGVFDAKSGVDLQFRNINAASNKVSVALDAPNKNVNVDVNEANLTLNNLGGTVSIAKGGTNSSTALNNNRVMVSSGGAIVESSAITANKALASDANGLPVATATTDTELGYLSGTTSSVQTQLNAKVAKSGDTMTGDLSFNSTKGSIYKDSGSNTVKVVAPSSVSTSYVLTLPVADGTNGQVLKTDGSGNLGWTSAASGESTTVSNVGTGAGQVYRDMTGAQINLKSINAGSNKLSITNNANDITLDVVPGNLDISTMTGVLPIGSGGTNSSTALNNNRMMISSGGKIVETSAITANKALASDTNGLPVASSVTDTELGYLSGVTSSVQTQINGKVSKAGGDTITASGAAVKPLVLKGAASQAANLFEVDDSTNAAVATVSSTGAVSASTDLTTKSYVDSANTTQDTAISGKVAKAGDTMTGNLVMSGQKEVRYGDSGSNYIGFKAPATVGTSLTFTLPAADGTSGQILSTNGSGVLSWASAGGGGDFKADGSVAMTGSLKMGGNTIYGDSVSSGNLTLDSTSHATKGNIVMQPSGGSVGIGTTSPGEKLHVSGGYIAVDNTYGLRAKDNGGTLRTLLSLTSSNNLQMMNTAASGDVKVGFNNASNTGSIRFLTDSATERMRVDNTGNVSVGVGTIATGARLDVGGGAINASPQGTSAGQGGEMRFDELAANGSNYVGFRAPDSIASNVTWILPAADGTAGQVLKTDGSGNLGWVSASSGSVTGVTASAPLASSGGATPDISLTGVIPVANGGTNSSTALNNNRVMVSSSGKIVEASAITANKALASDASGLPVASSVTDTELGYLSGVTSAVQTQINGKVSKSGGDTITASAAGVIPVVLKGAASQSANLFEVRDSSATLLLSVSSTGAVSASTDIATKSYVDTGTNSKVTKTGDTMTGNLVMDNQMAVQLREASAGGTNFVALRAPAAITTDMTLTFPATLPGTTGYLQTDSSGTLSWVTGVAAATATALAANPADCPANTFATTIAANGDLSCTAVDISTASVTGTLPISKGGTGQTTATAAFNALDPLTTKGDILTNNGTDSIRLAVGTNGYTLVADSTAAEGVKWAQSEVGINGSAVGVANGYVEKVQSVTATTTTTTLPAVTSGNTYLVTLQSNSTITLPAHPGNTNAMAQITVIIKQDSTGSRTHSFSPASGTIVWSSGTTPTYCTGANEESVYQFFQVQGQTRWYAAQVWRECP